MGGPISQRTGCLTTRAEHASHSIALVASTTRPRVGTKAHQVGPTTTVDDQALNREFAIMASIAQLTSRPTWFGRDCHLCEDITCIQRRAGRSSAQAYATSRALPVDRHRHPVRTTLPKIVYESRGTGTRVLLCQRTIHCRTGRRNKHARDERPQGLPHHRPPIILDEAAAEGCCSRRLLQRASWLLVAKQASPVKDLTTGHASAPHSKCAHGRLPREMKCPAQPATVAAP